MPIYAYRCNDCNHEFEQRQRMTDAPLEECPVCSGRVRRVVNSVGVVFKGGGFYVTDNRNGSSPNGSGKSTSSKKEEGAATSSQMDSTAENGEKAKATTEQPAEAAS